MPTAVDRRPSVDTRVGILPAQAPGLSRRDGAKVVEMFGGRDNLSEVERPATSAATDFRLNHKPRKKTKEDNQLRKLFNEASQAPTPHRAPAPRAKCAPLLVAATSPNRALLRSMIPTAMAASTRPSRSSPRWRRLRRHVPDRSRVDLRELSHSALAVLTNLRCDATITPGTEARRSRRR